MSKKESRHGKRADGKTQTSVSLREDVLKKAKDLAEKDNRSFSNWLDILLAEKIEEKNKKKK